MKNDALKEVNLIAVGTVIEGKIRSQGSVRIDGKLLGDIVANEAIAIGENGEVEGNITGKNVTVGGKVRGTINAAEKLVLEGKSVVRGDVRATRLVIDEGSVFDGRISMADKSSPEAKH